MTPTQWILLAIAIALVIAIYAYSRFDKRAMHREATDDARNPLLPPHEQQLDIFAGENFDEFGVGKPRRAAPRADFTRSAPDVAREGPVAVTARQSGRVAPTATPMTVGGLNAAAPESESTPVAESVGPVAPPARPKAQKKLVSLLIAGRDGQKIAGSALHAALRQQKLEYGERQIYHRMYHDQPVFSVASLVKPGLLDPAEADHFTTPGLMLFMVLPGPQQPPAAIRDMLVTAGRLAEALDGQVYDSRRQPLTPEAGRALQLDVEGWTAEHDAG
ncbi:MAG TPA: cell division protein ZipA C-terminal FtsZ-binding domain-containing protein [Nevskiaceae bacterium]|nr:cell division protein ZipA C-terminal FtsZ-binding domain-containing protein [Nevskiaceae bacterium]